MQGHLHGQFSSWIVGDAKGFKEKEKEEEEEEEGDS
jgi:hypothetical protein